jgi:hypothetical protein
MLEQQVLFSSSLAPPACAHEELNRLRASMSSSSVHAVVARRQDLMRAGVAQTNSVSTDLKQKDISALVCLLNIEGPTVTGRTYV